MLLMQVRDGTNARGMARKALDLALQLEPQNTEALEMAKTLKK